MLIKINTWFRIETQLILNNLALFYILNFKTKIIWCNNNHKNLISMSI